MENDLEKFIEQNREQFEKGAPSGEVWKKLETGLIQYHKRNARVLNIKIIKWSVAASVLVILGIGLVMFLLPGKRNNSSETTVAKVKPLRIDSSDKTGNRENPDTQKILAQKIAREKSLADDPFKAARKNLEDIPLIEKYDRSLFYYASLVESKQKQVDRLQKTDPSLYTDLKKIMLDLDEMYLKLKNTLPGSIYKQKVLEDMIENLKMQEIILNNQLQLLKKVSSSNNERDEKM